MTTLLYLIVYSNEYFYFAFTTIENLVLIVIKNTPLRISSDKPEVLSNAYSKGFDNL